MIKVVINKETPGLADALPNMHAQHCHRLHNIATACSRVFIINDHNDEQIG